MNPRVLLIQPSLRLSRDFIDYPYYCDLAVTQGAAVLREADYPVQIVNGFSMPGSHLHPLDPGYQLFGAPVDDLIEACKLGTPDVILVHLTPFHRPPHEDPILSELLEKLRASFPSTPLGLADFYQSGQHYIEASEEAIFEAYPRINGWLKHEAEDHLVAFCDKLAEASEAPVFVDGGEVHDLDALPLPAWDLIDLPRKSQFLYRLVNNLDRATWEFPVTPHTFPMLSSRGCPYRCGHCSSNPGRKRGETKGQRRYSADYINRHLGELKNRYHARKILFLDEMVNVESTHFDTLLTRLEQQDLAYDFPNGMRADHITQSQINRMRGRITTLSVSSESGVQRVVDEVVGKRLELPKLERALQMAHHAGIPTLTHFIIGNPGETRREINETLEFALHLHESYSTYPSVQYATPLPGTRLEKMALSEGALPIIHDFGPLFQQTPITRSDQFTPHDLKWFKWTFDQRLHAGETTNKIIMNVTYKCNNRCTFCAVGTRTQLDGSIERQAEILSNYRKKGVTMVDFDGGEPTIYPDLIRLLRYAHRIGFTHINVTTNGRMSCQEGFAKKLVTSGITTLLFSVHGPDEKTHTQQVGEPDAFVQTIAGIRNSVKFKPPGVELGMNITLTRTNAERLDEVAQLAWDLGLKWLNIQFLTPFGRATNRVNPDTQEAANRAMRVIDKWRDRMKFQVINLPFCFMPGYEEFLMGDLLKLERHMAFVNNDDVNLFEYLKERRSYSEQCFECPHKIFCGGFYELDDVPEPPWVFESADVYAPL